MKKYLITFSHHGREYSFIKQISATSSNYIFEIAYRTEIRSYMNNHNLDGDYTVIRITGTLV